MRHMPDLLARRAALTPDRPAMSEEATGRTLRFKELHDAADAAGAALKGLGVGEGDRVAIVCRNRIDFFTVLFACARLGAILVPLNWRAPEAELAPLVVEAAPRALVFGAEDAAVALALAARAGARPLGLDDAGPDGWAAALKGADVAGFAARRHWPADGIWYLLHTSGTTGKPKAVIQTFTMAHVNAVNLGQAIDLRRDDVTVNFLPLFHTAGINLHTLPTLFAGGEAIVLPGFDADAMLALLASGRVTTFFGVPAIYQALSLHAGFAAADLSGVRHWGCGGAPLPDALVHLFAARGILVANGMGMTETGPTVFLADPQTATTKIGSVGKAQILCETKIARPDGSEADADEPGELLIAGPGVTPGYWNDAAATAAAFTPDGWLRTGDLARRDADGCHYIVGRLKDMYISGGENVYPAEVENVLADHPGVLEAAVLGVPDERWGEVGHAFILPREGHAPSPAELVAHCRARLAAFKTPRAFTLLADFPRTPAGKVQKHLIPRPVAPAREETPA
jgi:fatty-acyl-CoA synthase